MTADIPVWVNSRVRWVTGIGRKTTCDDVINVLIRGEDAGQKETIGDSKEAQGYAIMERWRRMERPLDGRSRILKVWNAWGDAQNEVKFTLKRVSDWEADSGRGSPSRDSYRKRKHHHRSSKTSWPPHLQTIHPKRLAQLHHNHLNQKDPNNKLPETIEMLMKLILAQGETIQSQLRRLHEREHQIAHLEDETHRERVKALGSNYLLETYLKSQPDGAEDEDEEKGDDSGVVTEGGSDQSPPPPLPVNPPPLHVIPPPLHVNPPPLPLNPPPEEGGNKAEGANDEMQVQLGTSSEEVDENALEDLKARVELYEKLVKVNKRLEREEEALVRLHIKFRRLRSQQRQQNQSEGLRVLPDQELDEESHRIKEALLKDLDRVRLELEGGTREIEQISLAMAETESLIDARRHYLRRLHTELEASDRETERLSKELELIQRTAASESVETPPQNSASKPPNSGPPLKSAMKLSKPSTSMATCSSVNDTDSNSDTGLSSLHSSSEEGVYVLDTLV